MNNIRRLSIAVVALAAVVVVANLQLAWNLHSADYLKNIDQRSNTSAAVAAALPEYAARKLANPQEAQKVFAQQVTAGTVSQTLNPLYQSISQAYNGRSDVVSFSLDPLVEPVLATGYQIPPGTELANRTIQVNGLAAALRTSARVLSWSFIVLVISIIIMLMLNIKRGPLRPLRSVALLASLMLGGLYLAMWILPALVDSLLTSSGLDSSLRTILINYIGTITKDSGLYYLAWIVILLLAALAISIIRGITGRGHKPNHDKKSKDKKYKPLLNEPAVKEL